MFFFTPHALKAAPIDTAIVRLRTWDTTRFVLKELILGCLLGMTHSVK
jgi:hypothetical protein